MEHTFDFMSPALEQLKKIILDYGLFCQTAENLKWIDMGEQHEDWFRSYPLGIQMDVYTFPKDYIILYHIMDVYAQTVLSSMAYYEKLDADFWKIPQDKRKRCLIEARKWYENYAVLREPRLIIRDCSYLVGEIRFFADENKIPAFEQKRYFDSFDCAKVIELGGCYTGDAEYWAIKRNRLLVVSCGCWD